MPTAELGDLDVGEIMSRWPATIRVFLALRLHCIGCPISPFHTLVDAAREHQLAPDDLIHSVTAAINSTRKAGR